MVLGGHDEQRITVGGACATIEVPMLLAPPGRLSTTNCCLNRSDSACATSVRDVGGNSGRIRNDDAHRPRRIIERESASCQQGDTAATAQS